MKTIKSRLIWAFLSVIVALLISSLIFIGISIWEVRQYRAISNTMITQYRLIENAELLIHAYNDLAQGVESASEDSHKELEEANKEIKILISALDNTSLDTDSRSNYLGFKESMEDFIKHINDSIYRLEAGNLENYSSDYDEANKKFGFVRDNGATLIFSQLDHSDLIWERIDQNYQIAFILSLGLLGLIVIACIIFIFRFSKKLTEPLTALTYASQQLESDNPNFIIDEKILQEKSEIGLLANSFKTMTVKLRGKISQLNIIQVDQAKQLNELEKINKLMVGRELKMIELKKEISELKSKGEKNEET